LSQGYDPMYTSQMTISHFRRALDALQISSLGRLWLIEPEIDILIDFYRDPDQPNYACWHKFMDDIDQGAIINRKYKVKRKIYIFFFIYLNSLCKNMSIFHYFCNSYLVFTVKGLEKLPNVKVTAPSLEIAELPRKGATKWQCVSENTRKLCEEVLRKIRQRVSERRILLKQFFQHYDKYIFLYLLYIYLYYLYIYY